MVSTNAEQADCSKKIWRSGSSAIGMDLRKSCSWCINLWCQESLSGSLRIDPPPPPPPLSSPRDPCCRMSEMRLCCLRRQDHACCCLQREKSFAEHLYVVLPYGLQEASNLQNLPCMCSWHHLLLFRQLKHPSASALKTHGQTQSP